MNKQLKEKINEAFSAVLPITVIVLILSLFLSMPVGTIVMFIGGAALLIVGMGFFTLGADMAMMPMGEGIGAKLTRVQNLPLILIVTFAMGVVITIAEPDLQVLARQVPAIPSMTLILTVAVGVGAFLVIAILRILFRVKLSILLIIFYAIVFIFAAFTPNTFIPVAFDSGGVTTGPITVPFILAMGLGIAAIRSDKDSQDDSFGLVALCSVGPILAVMVLGIFYKPADSHHTHVEIPDVHTTRDVVTQFVIELPNYFEEVAMALAAIIVFFIVFQLISRRFHGRQLGRIMVGFLYTLIGLVLFLTGVNVGFIPVGHLIGLSLAGSGFKWLLIPLGMVVGYFIVAAEPAVHVLNKQVVDVSGGAIPQKAMHAGLSIGMAVALGMTMLRILSGIPLMWILIPGYLTAIVLTFFVPKIFTGIAFDSGGVCSGPMTSTFLLPFAMGACEGVGGNMLTDAFGVVAVVAMTPLITIQVMGVIYGSRMKAAGQTEAIAAPAVSSDMIIEYPEESFNE